MGHTKNLTKVLFLLSLTLKTSSYTTDRIHADKSQVLTSDIAMHQIFSAEIEGVPDREISFIARKD
jgi:hypothetical protein